MKKTLLLIMLSSLLLFCKTKKEHPTNELPHNVIPYRIVKIFPHDKSAFTQGLVVENGRLFESTGQHGTSWIAEIDIATGYSNKKILLDKQYFGEGVTIMNNKIYQLTWKNKVGFVYDLASFQKVKEFSYSHEGWGITHNGINLIVSDGTDQLHLLDTISLKEVAVIKVTMNEQPLQKLNELEYINGYIYANLWQTNSIFKIDPSNGKVVGQLDMTELVEKIVPLNSQADVLNGIAYEKKSNLLLITGKLWPAMAAVKIGETEQ